jgi:hypothetical protein
MPMHQNTRRALRRGRNAILWQNAVIGTAETRYFVQGLGERQLDSTDFRTLPDAEQCFDQMESGRR